MIDPLVYLGPPPRGFLVGRGQRSEDVRGRLSEISLPVLAMHGSGDLLVSPEALKDIFAEVSSDDLTAAISARDVARDLQ